MPSTFITTHPGKFLYTCLTISLILARLPFWIVYYLPTRTRPSKKWTFGQTIQTKILAALLKNFWKVEIKTPESLKPGKEGKQFVVIEPAPSSYYTGIVLKDPAIKPTAIGGTWYPAPLEKHTGAEDVVLHLHGGGYVIGDGRIKHTGHLAATILKHTSATHIFCPQYRLASNPGGQFPAALQDTITAILYLTLDLGIPAQRLIISGDSAGANLALALLRYILDEPRTNIPSPCAAWLWSAWIDPSNALVPGTYDSRTDYLSNGFGAWGARTYAPSKSTGLTLANPYIKFSGNAFPTKTPLFFSSGECEAILEETRAAYEEFKAVAENTADFKLEEGAPHDIILVARVSGFQDAAVVSAKAAGKFLESIKR